MLPNEWFVKRDNRTTGTSPEWKRVIDKLNSLYHQTTKTSDSYTGDAGNYYGWYEGCVQYTNSPAKDIPILTTEEFIKMLDETPLFIFEI